MKIGILTFHWGTNYGGVLQAYALQTFLSRKGHNVKIINYAPHTFRDSFYKCFYSKNPFTIINNLKNYWKEGKIRKFRLKHLNLTDRYYLPEELMHNPPKEDIYISGSDQIWNPYGLNSNKKIYFLPFGDEKIIKLAYAASFGVIDFPENMLVEIKPLLNKFKAISVRENSGLDILRKAEIFDSILLPDPTLLLSKNDYLSLTDRKKPIKTADYFFYILQNKQSTVDNIYTYLKRKKKNNIVHTDKLIYNFLSIEDWLLHIESSKMVITNSYHGVIFSIIFKTSFIVVPIEGKLEGMNDRIYTLLENYELSDRIIKNFDPILFEELTNKKIDWEKVNIVNDRLSLKAHDFFYPFT